MERRTTFALDTATIRRLRRLAKSWRVSQAEVVRRAIERVEREDEQTRASPLARLKAYHEAGGLDANAAKAYLEEVAENRSNWGRNL